MARSPAFVVRLGWEGRGGQSSVWGPHPFSGGAKHSPVSRRPPLGVQKPALPRSACGQASTEAVGQAWGLVTL